MAETESESEKVRKEPKVVVFGNEVDSKGWDRESRRERHRRWREEWRKRRHHGSFAWGFFLILLGLMFLFSNFGLLSPSVWSAVGSLWPILIVLIGLDVLFGHSMGWHFLSATLAFLIFLLVLGIVLTYVSPAFISTLPLAVQNFLHSVQSLVILRR